VLRDPHFARLVFGLPGIVLAIYGIINLLNIQQLSLNLIVGLVGIYLILKGFGIEDNIVRAFSYFKETTSIERASFPLYIASFFVLLLGLWAGSDNIEFVWASVPEWALIEGTQAAIVSMAAFTLGFIGLFTLAIILFFAGRIGDMYYKKEFHRIRKYARSIISMIAFFVLIDQAARFTLFWTAAIEAGPSFADLMVTVGASFMITVVGFLVVKYIYITKYVIKRIEKGMMIRGIDGKEIGKVSEINYKKRLFKYEKKNKKYSLSFGKVVVIREGIIIN